MYKILIVDDNGVERSGIKMLLKKHKFDFEIYEAENGIEALKIVQNNSIDIIYTDIRMPKMDGLQLIEKVRESNTEIKFIIYSGYDEFEYAKKAIAYGVDGYILKPIAIEEFLEVIKKSISNLDKMYAELDYKKVKYLTKLLGTNDKELINEISEKLEQLDITFSDINRIILMYSDERIFQRYGDDIYRNIVGNRDNEYIYVNLNECESVLFLLGKENATDEKLQRKAYHIRDVLKKCSNSKVFIVVSNIIDENNSIYNEYKIAQDKLENKFFYNESKIFYTQQSQKNSQNNQKDMEELEIDIIKNIAIENYEQVIHYISDFFELVQKNNINSILYVKYLSIETIKKLINNALYDNYENKLLPIIDEIDKTNSLIRLKQQLIQCVLEIKQLNKDKTHDIQGTINIVKKIIKKEYGKNIGLEYLASKVFLSPCYLSDVFKKTTSMSVIEFITITRLEHGQRLLMTTNKKVSDISKEIGYENPSYFGQLFKSRFGLTPNKYRNRNKNDEKNI